MAENIEQLRAYIDYFRDMGVHHFYRRGEPIITDIAAGVSEVASTVSATVVQTLSATARTGVPLSTAGEPKSPASVKPDYLEPPIPKLVSFDDLAPLPEIRVPAKGKPDALRLIHEAIGDCTRSPLAYAGRHT